MVEYMVRRTVERHDLSNVEGQSAAVASALPILQELTGSGPPERVRAPARRPDGGLGGLGAHGAGAPARRASRAGREDAEAAVRARSRGAGDAPAARARSRDLRRVRAAAHRRSRADAGGPGGARRVCASTPGTWGRWPAPTTRRSRRRPAPSRSSRSRASRRREYAAHVLRATAGVRVESRRATSCASGCRS